jgi:hypothetical protein
MAQCRNAASYTTACDGSGALRRAGCRRTGSVSRDRNGATHSPSFVKRYSDPVILSGPSQIQLGRQGVLHAAFEQHCVASAGSHDGILGKVPIDWGCLGLVDVDVLSDSSADVPQNVLRAVALFEAPRHVRRWLVVR